MKKKKVTRKIKKVWRALKGLLKSDTEVNVVHLEEYRLKQMGRNSSSDRAL